MGFSSIFLNPINTGKLGKMFSEEVDDYKLEVAKIMKRANESNENKTAEE